MDHSFPGAAAEAEHVTEPFVEALKPWPGVTWRIDPVSLGDQGVFGH